jgi:hypothetical protein
MNENKEGLKHLFEFSKACLPMINKKLEEEGIRAIDEMELKEAFLWFSMTHSIEKRGH